MLRVLYIITLLSIALILPAHAQHAHVRKIVVVSKWAGLSVKPVKPERYTIVLNDSHYIHDGHIVDNKDVQRLVKALRAAVISKPSRKNLGLTTDWLAHNANTSLAVIAPNASSSQRKLFLQAYRNPAIVKTILPVLCKPMQHTDDYPSVKVTLTTAEGGVLVATAASQAPFMIPWTITSGSHAVVTWNANISRSLSALLPAHFLNGPRLSGNNLPVMVAYKIRWHIQPSWNIAGATDAIPHLMMSLQKHYTVDNARAIHAYNDDFQSEQYFEEHHPVNIFTTLHRDGDPENFKIYFIAPDQGQGVSAPTPSLVARYAKMVWSTPWLAQVIRQHPDWDIGIRIVNSRSLSRPGVKAFIEDMKDAGKPALAKRVKQSAKNIALLISGRGRWLLFPDHEAILWRAVSFDRQSWLGFFPNRFAKHGCDDLTNNCPAILIDPNGHIVTRRKNNSQAIH